MFVGCSVREGPLVQVAHFTEGVMEAQKHSQDARGGRARAVYSAKRFGCVEQGGGDSGRDGGSYHARRLPTQKREMREDSQSLRVR